jgi:DNA (cytosine-5)-methyltransferase 1
VNYYNEHDRFCAAWLRNLMAAGLIADGEVDERSIEDVRPRELYGFTQCHFFAGIGIWSAALRAGGWPDDRPLWTGSCPCQPFSAAGKGGGFADERHLWPAFHHLIRECRPPIVFGEQVASRDGLRWLDLVHSDMEAEGYAFGAADLCAAGAGAAHIRQRLYWVGHADGARSPAGRETPAPLGHGCSAIAASSPSLVADASGTGFSQRRGNGRIQHEAVETPEGQTAERSSDAIDWLTCTDGKLRPTQSGIFPLVDAWPTGNRVAILRAAGNALHLGTARQFIKAVI